uniref:Flagellar basal-body rod protein FlgF n=1 Tax=Thermorudis peleae TaxID=1382356 RepID=A0A831TF06_9BACT
MIRSIYQAASAMMAQMARQLTISTNLSNVDTPGYRQQLSGVNDFREMLLSRVAGADVRLIGSISTAVRLDQPELDLSQGALVETGQPLDLAIAGAAFFTVQTPEGLQYTRDGRFRLDEQRRLVTADGFPVLGEGGPITIPPGDVWVDPDGTVRVNDQVIGRLLLTEFPADAQLQLVEQNRYTSDVAGVPSQTAGVSQGFLEQSNVDITRAITDMLAANRSYALAQRALQIADDSLRLAVNEIGKISA